MINLELETIEKAQGSVWFLVQELRNLRQFSGASKSVSDMFTAKVQDVGYALNALYETLSKEGNENH